MTVGDKTSVVVQVFLYFFAQVFNVLTDVGIFVEDFKSLGSCDDVLNDNKTKTPNVTIICSGGENFTRNAIKEAKTDSMNILVTIGVFLLIAVILFIIQMVMYLKYLKARCSSEFEFAIDKSTFLKHFYKFHGLFLFLEAILHDLPIGFVVVELCMLVWKQPNCWECVSLYSAVSPSEVSLAKTNLWLGIKLVSLVPVTMYKGMFPMFVWIGGPCCGMDCYICRVCIVMPCGILATLLLLTPLCGSVMLRLVPAASGINEGVPNTVWSIGIIFWAMAIIIGTLLCVCCVPSCRHCCFRYGPCKWLGLDCCGLGGDKKKTIKIDDS